MKKALKIIFGVCLLLGGLFFLGPRPDFEAVSPELTPIGVDLESVAEFVKTQNNNPEIKPGNESILRWADSVRQTPYALVYLHGFSASPMEGNPVHMEVADRYGMNFYAPRLARHGLKDPEAFRDLTPKELLTSAKEALQVGKLLGERVVLMSCSTGGTLSIYLSAHYPEIAANVLYSPNIAIFDPTARMMTGPWGEQIVRAILGDYRTSPPEDRPKRVQEKIDQYWYQTYPVEGLIALQSLLDQTMKEAIYEQVNQPYFLGYYYKDDSAQDQTVSVEAMKAFAGMTGTPKSQKRVQAFPEAQAHVIISPLQSESVLEVREATFRFLEQVLQLEPR